MKTKVDYCKIIREKNMEPQVRAGVTCEYCGLQKEMVFLKKEYEDWLLGKGCFPNAKYEDREMMKYGICAKCALEEL